MDNSVVGSIFSFLVSEEGLNLLAWVFGLSISAILGSDKIKNWLDAQKIEKLNKAKNHLEAAVLENRDLVAKMKEAGGGKLTEEQKKELEAKVVENLKNSARETGFDAVKVIGPELIKPAIAYAVKRLKSSLSGGGKELPTDVQKLFEGK